MIRDARLRDVEKGGWSRDRVSILILQGRIAEVAPGIDAPGVAVLDVSGARVLPGLIDAHVHLASIPGAEVRQDPPSRRRALRAQHLRSYLACGVTTVLDTGTDAATAREVQAWLAAGNPGPTVLTLGPPVASAGGYMSRGPGLPLASEEELGPMLDALESLGAVGIKVPLERGFGSDEVFPIHSPDLRAAIARQAAERGLPIYVHASDEVEQTLGLEMKAHALAHTNFAGKEPSADFPSRVVRSGAYMITTFSCIDAGLARWQPARLQDALVKVAVPAEERSTAASSDAWAALDRSELGHAFPDTPAIALRLFAWLSPPQEEPEKEALEVNLRAARRLHVEGVPLVIGSDAGNSSVLSQFHGTSTIRELELLSRAGVANAAVLDAATRVAARMLGIEADAGVIEPGRRGDLVVLDGDPLVDMSAMRRIRWTIKEGVARTPRQWMASSTRPPAPGG